MANKSGTPTLLEHPWRWLGLALFILLVALLDAWLLAEGGGTGERISGLQRPQRQALGIADEILQISDDLTRLARYYVASGNPLYKRWYQDIRDMQNGKIPHPDPYTSRTLRLMLSGQAFPGLAAPQSLRERVEQMALPAEEARVLVDTLEASDRQYRLDADIMGQFEAAAGAAEKQDVLRRLFDANYQAMKLALIAPVEQLSGQVNSRIRTHEVNQDLLSKGMQWELIANSTLLILLLLGLAFRQRKTSSRVAEDNRRLLDIIDQAPDFISTATPDKKLSYINPRGRAMLGIKPNASLRDVAISDLHPSWANALVENEGIPAALRDGHWYGENALLALDGREIQVSQLIIAHRNSKGDLTGLSTIIRDISRKVEREQVSRQLLDIIELAPSVIGTISTNGQLTYLNPYGRNMLGIDRDSDLKFFKLSNAHPPWAYRRLAEEGIPGAIRRGNWSGELALINREGHEVPISQLIIAHKNAKGALVGLSTIIRDISKEKEVNTALRKSANRLWLAAEVTGFGTYDYDLKKGKLDWSKQFRRLAGLPLDTEADFKHLRTVIHPEDWDSFLAMVTNTCDPEISVSRSLQNEYRVVRPNGEVRWWRDIRQCQFQGSGAFRRVARVIGTVQDITESRQLLDELQTHRQHLEQLVEQRTRELSESRTAAEAGNAAKSNFMANMSHEIRNPLNTIGLLAGLLCRDGRPQQKDHLARKIQANVTLLSRLVDDILDFSKIEAGEVVLATEPFSLEPMICDLKAQFDEVALTKGLVLHWPNPLPPSGSLLGDYHRLLQVLGNLLSNAIKFTDSGEVQLQIAVQKKNRKSITLKIQVIDTGIGIAAEAIPTLMQPFTQADSSITRRYGGTGLGLSITHRLIELMGSHLDVTSTPGLGSCFAFCITLHRANGNMENSNGDTVLGHDRLKELRLMVVDDDPDNLDAMRMLLESEGAQIDTLRDGDLAYQNLRDHSNDYDAVLMDIQMPVMDGITATRLIRNVLGLVDLPIYAVTAGVLPHQQEAALDVGITELIRKPIDGEALIERLAKLPRRVVDGEQLSDRTT